MTALLVTPDGGFLGDGPGTGELVVWTPFQTRGYLTSALNEGKFTTYPETHGDTIFFRTGDIVRRHEDGSMTLGGAQRLLRQGPRRAGSPPRSSSRRSAEHPDVVEVAVVAVPDEMAGSRLHALVRKEADSKLNSLKVRQHCAGRLARTEMPSSIEVVTEPLPKTPTGKIDRKRCVPRQDRTAANG